MTPQFNIRPSAHGVKILSSEQKDAQKQFESKIPVQVALLGGVLGAGALLVEEGAIAAFVVAELPAIIIALGAMVVGYGLWQLVKILTNPTPQQASNLLNDAHLKSKMPTKIQEHLILHAEGGKSKSAQSGVGSKTIKAKSTKKSGGKKPDDENDLRSKLAILAGKSKKLIEKITNLNQQLEFLRAAKLKNIGSNIFAKLTKDYDILFKEIQSNRASLNKVLELAKSLEAKLANLLARKKTP